MPKLGTIFTKKLLKMLGTSSSSFISAPFSLKTIFSAEHILLEKGGLTEAQFFFSYSPNVLLLLICRTDQ